MKLIITNSIPIEVKDGEVVLSPLLSNNTLGNIDEYVGDSEAEEIEVLNLNQIPLPLLGSTLTNYVKKLRLGGTITVHGRELYQICLQIVNRKLDLGAANQTLYGGPGVHEMLASMVSVNDVAIHLQSLGLKITSKRIDGINFYLEAERT